MRRIALVVVVLTGLIAPAFAQRAEIEAVNAKWVDFFNKGDFVGVASLYTEDATAFPPGAGMMKGRAAIEAMWKGAAEQVGNPKFITLEVKPLGPSAAQEIGTFSLKMKGPTPQEVTGKYVVVWEKVGTRNDLNALLKVFGQPTYATLSWARTLAKAHQSSSTLCAVMQAMPTISRSSLELRYCVVHEDRGKRRLYTVWRRGARR